MSLSADPSVTYNSQGNILATSTSITGGSSNTGNIVDFSSNSLGGWVCVYATGGGSVSATNGCQLLVYPAGDSTPHYDTVAMAGFTLAMTASTVSQQTIFLPTGKYSLTLKNLDASNAITAGITSNPVA